MTEEAPDSQRPGKDGLDKGESPGAATHGNPKDRGLLVEGLALMPERAILDEAKLAGILHVTPRTIRRMVSRHELPPSIPLAGRSVWFAGRVLAHIEGAIERAERDADRNGRRIRQHST